MTNRNRLIASALALLLAGSLASTALARELKLSTPTPEPHIMTKAGRHLAEAFGSDGAQDTIAVYPANKLGDVPTVLSLLQSGAIEFAIVPVGDLANRDPSFLAWYLPSSKPLMMPDARHAVPLRRRCSRGWKARASSDTHRPSLAARWTRPLPGDGSDRSEDDGGLQRRAAFPRCVPRGPGRHSSDAGTLGLAPDRGGSVRREQIDAAAPSRQDRILL